MSTNLDAARHLPVAIDEIETTADIPIPTDPLQRVIGQERAVEIARIAAFQHRHLLLVGPSGIGKSMTAQALALHLDRPRSELRVVHNPENPERPSIEIASREEVYHEREAARSVEGELISPKDAPASVAERLGTAVPGAGSNRRRPNGPVRAAATSSSNSPGGRAAGIRSGTSSAGSSSSP